MKTVMLNRNQRLCLNISDGKLEISDSSDDAGLDDADDANLVGKDDALTKHGSLGLTAFGSDQEGLWPVGLAKRYQTFRAFLNEEAGTRKNLSTSRVRV